MANDSKKKWNNCIFSSSNFNLYITNAISKGMSSLFSSYGERYIY